MENLLTAIQMKDADAYTIQHQNITSVDLMERAAVSFVEAFAKKIVDKQQSIVVICGQGNNGGDGLAIARLLNEQGYHNLKVFLTHFSEKSSADYQVNLERLKGLLKLEDARNLALSATDVVIDAILGAGLNRPLSGNYEYLAQLINQSGAYVVAVDVPTGFKSEGALEPIYNGVSADYCITFERPKINFFFPESLQALKAFEVVPIGLAESCLQNVATPWKLISEKAVGKLLKPRSAFSHKGTYGHALVIAGNPETMGAALLCTSACLNAGAGLVTACIPQSGLTALNVALPEAMFLNRESIKNVDLPKFKVAAIGPGLGVGKAQADILSHLLDREANLVVDADAINILADQKELLNALPAQSIITPHMKEFDRLFGNHNNWWDRVATASIQSQKLQLVIVLKNQYTFICVPSGDIFINTTGNPAMAQGGMGDVLTGVITSFLAQGYSAAEAAILGVFLHGKSGDYLAQKRAVVSASLLSQEIPRALKKLLSNVVVG
ncbi:NAD(P)H-hydrate dehydratase [Nubsella zeaxanthinifaciens]|uniref:NAD(P)H-hydrate dehydratase n=1 Tax=Nubsella zeaxanthinifaciens TaxID=392412 RepID=UPI003D042699